MKLKNLIHYFKSLLKQLTTNYENQGKNLKDTILTFYVIVIQLALAILGLIVLVINFIKASKISLLALVSLLATLTIFLFIFLKYYIQTLKTLKGQR